MGGGGREKKKEKGQQNMTDFKSKDFHNLQIKGRVSFETVFQKKIATCKKICPRKTNLCLMFNSRNKVQVLYQIFKSRQTDKNFLAFID